MPASSTRSPLLLAFGLPLLAAQWAPAQVQPAQSATSSTTSSALPSITEQVFVLGEADPVKLGETSRSGEVLDATPIRLNVSEPADLLRTDSSVDLQQRGGGGTQADIGIRGASFEQTLVLLDGLRWNDVETSHFNFDLPVPLETIAAVDVLHGAGSTLYGSDAIGGVVNVRSVTPTENSLRLRSALGSYGINTQSALLSGAGTRWSALLGGGRDFSSGFVPDRDYRSEEASFQPRLSTRAGLTNVLLAGSDRAYGADQFYGNYPSFERTKGWYALLHQDFGSKTHAALGYRRHTDRFVLVRSNPGLYTNQHIDESWEALLRRSDALGNHLQLATGLEEDLDSIHSNNLGRHARNRGAGYAEAALHGDAWRVAFGGRQELLSGGASVFSPSVSANMRLLQGLKLRGAIGHGFRLPTYTDLYYSDPTTSGNAALQPESAWSYEMGADWTPRPTLRIGITGFTSPQHNSIDYTRSSSAERWHATNLASFRYTGAELTLQWQASRNAFVRTGYTFVSGAQSALGSLQSRYVFNFPVHKAEVEWIAQLPRYGVQTRARLEVTDRFARAPYPVLDLSAARSSGRLQPYLQITNATNTGYQEVVGVRMQGRAYVGGVALQLSRAPR